MEVVKLEDGKFALEIPLQEPYIRIKKYEPYGEEVGKTTITTLTEDMYVEWEVSERHNNIHEFAQSITKHQNSVAKFIKSVRDCCEYNLYTEQDILDYQNFIEQQDDYGDIELSKTYYDSRAIEGKMEGDFSPSMPIQYDVKNSQEIPQKNKKLPFWIEVHTDTEQDSLHVCFHSNIVRLLGGNIYFILDTDGKYVILEACRVFAALNDNKKIIQKAFTICLDSFKIAQAFGLNPGEYKIDESPGENSYRISPKYENAKLKIWEIYSPKIFNLYNLTMRKCIFGSTVKLIKETGIDTTILSKNIVFRRCSFEEGIFMAKIHIEEKITFEDCIFKRPTSSIFMNNYCVYFDDTIFLKRASFQASLFNGRVSFTSSHFKDKAFFSLAIFKQEILFRETVFENNAYFDDTKFLDEADFSQSEFYKNAHFYGTMFEKFPSFIQAIFNGNINFTNTELDFGYDEVRKKIEETYQDRKSKYGSEQDKEEPKRHKIANEFRDSFRNIKSTLIKDNNMLDASNYHQVELYCKELELEYKKKGEPQTSTTRDFVDRIQLMFYRLTSDHHTDLLLILNNVLALIVLFGGFAYGLCCFASYATKWVDCECCTSAEVYYLYSLTTDSFCIDCNIWNVFCIETFLIISLCCVFVAAFILLMLFFNYVNTICRELGYWFIAFFVLNLFIIAIKPALILPIFGKLIDESLKIDFPAFTSLSIVYAILMFLLIFSLQKTARKNTIVPS